MTTLVVEELKNGPLVQEFDHLLATKRQLAYVRPYLYLHNYPLGTFTLSLLDANDALIASSSFNQADFYNALDTTDAYAHGFLRLPITASMPRGKYKLSLSSMGYTFFPASYIGWVREHEDEKVKRTFTPASDLENPLTFELWFYA